MSYYHVMESNEYRAQLAGFRADLIRLETELSEIDILREEKRKQIEQTKRVINDLALLCGEVTEEDISVLGFTDACRQVLRKSYPNALTAVELRDALSQGGYDLSPYSNALASIYTILRRLKENKQVIEDAKDFKTVYKWNPKRYPRRRNFLRHRRRKLGGELPTIPKRNEG